MSSSRVLPQLKLRLKSKDLKEWIVAQAEKNHRTLNGEVNYHLEQAMHKEKEGFKGEK